jgi:hypothetical protein
MVPGLVAIRRKKPVAPYETNLATPTVVPKQGTQGSATFAHARRFVRSRAAATAPTTASATTCAQRVPLSTALPRPRRARRKRIVPFVSILYFALVDTRKGEAMNHGSPEQGHLGFNRQLPPELEPASAAFPATRAFPSRIDRGSMDRQDDLQPLRISDNAVDDEHRKRTTGLMRDGNPMQIGHPSQRRATIKLPLG